MIALVLLRKYWQLAVIVTLVGALVLACHARDQALIQQGRAEEQLRTLREKTHRDSVAGEVAAAVVRTDTIRLTQWIRQRDTLRTTLRLTDTVRVREFIAVQDSTIQACRQSVLDFGTLCAKKDSLIADYRAQLAVKQTVPAGASKSQRVLWFLGGLAAGAVVDRVIPR